MKRIFRSDVDAFDLTRDDPEPMRDGVGQFDGVLAVRCRPEYAHLFPGSGEIHCVRSVFDQRLVLPDRPLFEADPLETANEGDSADCGALEEPATVHPFGYAAERQTSVTRPASFSSGNFR
ncbi:hypothetical protein [Natrononativus amylolyticus]|uniref:hypothetical protein n=1 Tax=Natrononativus amylolyticus TaxID=2963434 RepID=UPI0031F31BCC